MPRRYDPDPFDPQEFKRLRMFFYLIPVIGFFPAVWTLSRRQGDRKERSLSRLVVVLALGWMVGYLSLGTSAHVSESMSLWIATSVVTSSYFGINLWLMWRLWQRKSLRLPGISDLSDRLP